MKIPASQKISECFLQSKTNAYELIEARSGYPVVKVMGQLFNSIYDPLKEAEKRASAYNFSGKKAAFLFGDGFYYLAEYLSNKLDLLVYVFEADPGIARLAFDKRKKGSLNSFSIVFIDEVRVGNIPGLLIPFDSLQADDVVMIEHLPSINVFKEDYTFIQNKILEEFKKGIANISTTAFFGRRWLLNILLNLKREKKFFDLRGAKRHVDYLITAPGPTLDGIITEIRKFRERYKIIALAPSLRNLLSNGIIPDFVCSMDGGYANALHLAGINLDNVPLIYPLYVNSNVLRLWKGPRFPVSFNLSVERSLTNKESLPAFIESANVSVFAVQAAVYLGAKTVYLAGMDFASYSCKGHCRDYRFIQDIHLKSSRSSGIEKFLETPWRNNWEKQGLFLSDKKFISYKNELMDFLKKSGVKIKTVTSSPFLEGIPLVSVDSIKSDEKITYYSPNGTKKDEFLNKSNLEIILNELQKILIMLREKKNLNEALMKTILKSESTRPLFEFLRAADIFSFQKGKFDKAVEGFFTNILYDIEKIIKIIG
ncbi:MAG: motility associated factor glycosyltransferase family protein [Spirochaetes bacterium]|nr:motility associated factor glycosyltransferase family protein [Spirochaetota bacterium]